MHYLMFDIDGTLLDSYALGTDIFVAAVKAVTGIVIETDWQQYPHVTNTDIVHAMSAVMSCTMRPRLSRP